MYRYIAVFFIFTGLGTIKAFAQQPDSTLSVTQEVNKLLGKFREGPEIPKEQETGSKAVHTPLTYTKVPLGSNDNSIKLTVVNSLNSTSTRFKIRAVRKPSWVSLTSAIKKIKIKYNEQQEVTFYFSVAANTEIGTKTAITFSIMDRYGHKRVKKIGLQVASPPFKLFNNYPNPFNPTTTIQYLLPARMKVKVQVYNVIGRKVATLIDGRQEAGKHQLRWDASRMASGIYFYRVIAKGKSGRSMVKQKKMMLIK